MATEKTLRPDQLEDLASLMVNDRFMLLSDPGTGKTPPVCVYLYWLWNELNKRAVWIMPKTLRKKNRLELLEWSEFAPDDVLIYEGGPVVGNPKVLIMTFERWRRAWRFLLETFPDIDSVAVDEWQLGYKTEKSSRTQELYRAMEHIRRLVPMSGTLIAGRLDSAYPAINLIEPRYYSGHAHFLMTHAITDAYGKILAWANHDKLAKILLNHGSSRSFEDVYGKENKVLQVESVDMAPGQRTKYEEFEANALLELEDRFLDGSQAGVNAIRCRQIMAHPEKLSLPIDYDIKGKPIAWKDYNLVGHEQTGKDAALEIHLENHKQNGQQVAIFGVFEPEIERIAAMCRRIGLRTGIIHGGIPSKDRERYDEQMRTKELDAIVATCATAGVGLNWPELNHMIFSSLDYQDDHFFQAYRRAMRGIRPHPLWITILEYIKSLDQPIMAIVERKSRDANKVDPNRQAISFRGTKTSVSDCDKKSPIIQPLGKAAAFVMMQQLKRK